MNMLFAPAELNPYDWWLIVSERLWNERMAKDLDKLTTAIIDDPLLSLIPPYKLWWIQKP